MKERKKNNSKEAVLWKYCPYTMVGLASSPICSLHLKDTTQVKWEN